MHLTIHIGPHKTGTTALQSAFAEGARRLRRDGVLYPRANWLYPAQHRLAFALKGRRIPGSREVPDREAELASLLTAIKRHKGNRILISSEEFFACPSDALDWLKTRLGPRQVDIITFLRRPDTFLVSSYNQQMRQPGNGFATPIQRFVETPRRIAPEIDFRACVSAWADVFGNAAMHLHTYEACPPLATTLRHLGLPADALTANPGVNRSVPGAVVETMRYAKAIGLAPDRQRRLLKLAAEVFAKEPPFYLSDPERRDIIRTFEADNTALFQRFGQTNPYAVQNFTPMSRDKDHNLSHRDLMRLVDRLF